MPATPTPPAFTALCEALCARLGTDCPPLQVPGQPVPGLRIRIGDVDVELLQAAVQDGSWGLLLVHLGEMPAHQEATAHLTLLQANFMLMGPSPAVFAIHPVTGEALVYQSFAVATVNADRLELAARELVGIAMRWQRGEFLGEGQAQAGPDASPSTPMAGHPSQLA